MDKPTLDSILGERLAAMVREKYPCVYEGTEIIQLQIGVDINDWYLKEGGYPHRIPQEFNYSGLVPPGVKHFHTIEVGKFELWAEGKNEYGRLWNVHWIAYVPEHDMLFIA